MLPTETFAEVVAFLRLFDLGALAVANALISSIAVEASSPFRWEEFPGLHFYISNGWIQICRDVDTQAVVAPGHKDVSCHPQEVVATLPFSTETAMIAFVADACPNCVFDDVTMYNFRSKGLLDGIGQVADAVIIKGALRLDVSTTPHDWLDLLRKFRKVKALRLLRPVSDDEAEEIANFFGQSGIQELQYYRPGSAFMKLPMF